MFQVQDPRPKTQLRRSKKKDYIPNENDKRLRSWVDDWRRKTAVGTYGAACVKRFGCSNIMTDQVLDQVCHAAHHGLISSVDNLYKETRWHFTYKYGRTIAEKIKEMLPIAPPPAKVATVWKCSELDHVHIAEMRANWMSVALTEQVLERVENTEGRVSSFSLVPLLMLSLSCLDGGSVFSTGCL